MYQKRFFHLLLATICWPITTASRLLGTLQPRLKHVFYLMCTLSFISDRSEAGASLWRLQNSEIQTTARSSQNPNHALLQRKVGYSVSVSHLNNTNAESHAVLTIFAGFAVVYYSHYFEVSRSQ